MVREPQGQQTTCINTILDAHSRIPHLQLGRLGHHCSFIQRLDHKHFGIGLNQLLFYAKGWQSFMPSGYIKDSISTSLYGANYPGLHHGLGAGNEVEIFSLCFPANSTYKSCGECVHTFGEMGAESGVFCCSLSTRAKQRSNSEYPTHLSGPIWPTLNFEQGSRFGFYALPSPFSSRFTAQQRTHGPSTPILSP